MIPGRFASFLRGIFATACFTFILFLASLRVQASDGDHADLAISAAKSWVGQIDSGNYDDSYSSACEELRNRYPEDQWDNVLKALRGPWGAVVTRQQLSHVYKPNGAFGLDGECMVITYSTNFKNYSNVTESITLKWEDGQWRGAAYFAGVLADPNAPPPTPNYTTDVQTQPHVSPQGQ